MIPTSGDFDRLIPAYASASTQSVPIPAIAHHSRPKYFALLTSDRSAFITLFLLYCSAISHDNSIANSTLPAHMMSHHPTPRARLV